MTVMDPWTPKEYTNQIDIVPEKQSSFEDNFINSCPTSLPDSEEYLAKLEEKLQKIKKNPNLLRELCEKRELCMRELLNTNNVQLEPDFEEEYEATANSQLLRNILSQRHPQSRSEIVDLLHHDQLGGRDTEEGA